MCKEERTLEDLGIDGNKGSKIRECGLDSSGLG
jgi:hypothetical protein